MEVYRSAAVFTALLLLAHSCHAQQALCQRSSQNPGEVYTPNIPDFYFTPANAAAFSSINLTETVFGTTYIFTIPAVGPERNCSGTVTSLQFCYQVSSTNRGTRTIFDFLVLRRNSSTFTVIDKFPVKTNPSTGCVNNYCCTSDDLSGSNEFEAPTTEFNIGLVVSNVTARPLVFRPSGSAMEYNIPQYQSALGLSRPQNGGTFTLGAQDLVNGNSLILLRFFLEPDPLPTTEQVTTMAVTTTKPTMATQPTAESTTTIMTTESATAATIPATTMVTESTTAATTSPTSMTTQATTATTKNPTTGAMTTWPTTDATEQADTSNVTKYNTDTTFASTAYTIPDDTTSAPQTTLGNIQSVNPGTIGGAVGGFFAGFFIVVLVVVAIVTSVRRHRRKSAGMSESNGLALANATYAGVTSGTDGEASSQGTHYAGKGPHSYCEVGTKSAVPVYLTFGVTRTKTGNEEDIYMVPALDVEGLYSQLSNIKTQTLARKSIGLGMQLGNGQFGMVFKGVWYSSKGKKIDVAVKTLKEGSGEQDRVKFLQEAAIMGQFRHPNVVTMYGVVSEGEPVLLVLELLCKGDLRGYLLNMRTDEEGGDVSVSELTLLSYCRQVASGMTYLSSKAFVHRDLAARNILVSDDEMCKIADFGMSRDLMDENYYVSHGGKIPVKWTAPEALHYKKYSTASDVWSYGALMYEIWSVGHKPFENHTNPKALELIDTGYRLSPPPGCPRALYSIMISCWNPVPSERPGFTEISRELSLPDSKLLKWSEEDKRVHPEAARLGADLLCAGELYKDLQARYIQV